MVPIHKECLLGFPGYRAALRFSWGNFSNFIAYLLNQYFSYQANGVFFHTNVIIPQEKIKKRSIVPHVDDMEFGFSVWLNTPNEIKNYPGTAFYKNIELNTCEMNCHNEEKYSDYLEKYFKSWGDQNEYCEFDSSLIDKSVWKPYFISEMTFNSMVFYSGKLFHQAFVKPHYFLDCERISLSGVAK